MKPDAGRCTRSRTAYGNAFSAEVPHAGAALFRPRPLLFAGMSSPERYIGVYRSIGIAA